MCAQWDVYYCDEIGDLLEGRDHRIKRFTQYITLKTTGSDHKTWDDYLIESDAEKILNGDLDEDSADNLDRPRSVSAQNLNKWGVEMSEDDYKFLNAQYSEWDAKCVIDSRSREVLVRDLCMLRLQQNKAMASDNLDLYQKLTDVFQKTLDRASLSPKQEDAQIKSTEKPLGVLIQQFENERPVPEPDPEWGDVDGIMKIILVFFIGHLCKMLGIKNRYAQMYEDEMDKYRPHNVDGEDLDSEDIFDQLLESGFSANGVTLTGGDVEDGEEEE